MCVLHTYTCYLCNVYVIPLYIIDHTNIYSQFIDNIEKYTNKNILIFPVTLVSLFLLIFYFYY